MGLSHYIDVRGASINFIQGGGETKVFLGGNEGGEGGGLEAGMVALM